MKRTQSMRSPSPGEPEPRGVHWPRENLRLEEPIIIQPHKTSEPPAASEPAAEPASSAESSANSGESAIRAELDRLKAERDQLVDRLARLQAEFENARKRAERERRGVSRLRDRQRGGAVSAGAGQLRAGAEVRPARQSSCAPAWS